MRGYNNKYFSILWNPFVFVGVIPKCFAFYTSLAFARFPRRRLYAMVGVTFGRRAFYRTGWIG